MKEKIVDIKKFLEIEEKYDLYNHTIDGVQYWLYARIFIFNFGICEAGMHLGEVHKKVKNSFGKKIELAANLIYHAIFKHKLLKKNIDILFLNHERRIQNQQYYECAYTESLAKEYTDSVTLEKPYEYRHFKPVKTRNLIYMDYIMVKAYLCLEIQRKLKTREYRRLYYLVKKQVEQPLKELKEAYAWEENEENIYALIVEKIILYRKEYMDYWKLIDKLNPCIIVEVVSYCMQNMIINEISKKRGIMTIELQHGTIYPEHAAYQYAEHVKINQFPDKIFLFSEFWKKYMNVPISQENIISTGYPFFEEKIKNYKREAKAPNIKTLLFISQGTIGLYLSRLAEEVAKMLSSDNYRIIYKLHPAEYQTWKERYPWLVGGNIEVIAQMESIYKYFALSDVQIGVYSTALYEGLGFGLQTLILRVGYYSSMEALVNEGYAQYIDCAEDVIDYLNENHCKGDEENQFWEKNALQNMKNEIDNLLKERRHYV